MLKGCVRECNMRKIQNGEINSLKGCIDYVESIYEKIEDITKGF